MNQKTKSEAIKYIKAQIEDKQQGLDQLEADLDILVNNTPEIPTWSCLVSSAWSSEGEPDWSGNIEAPTLKDAVYESMLHFCRKAGRVYPGKKFEGRNSFTWDHFDVQGTIYVSLLLPNGSTVSADQKQIAKLKDAFNKKAPEPKKKPRKREGITV